LECHLTFVSGLKGNLEQKKKKKGAYGDGGEKAEFVESGIKG